VSSSSSSTSESSSDYTHLLKVEESSSLLKVEQSSSLLKVEQSSSIYQRVKAHRPPMKRQLRQNTLESIYDSPMAKDLALALALAKLN